ncbi:hypothetical protein ACFY1L_41015 [Streptomyces sp. NPDC001663]|uniref:hypothetical protein n=1 Tax=Streptomyces sp. NPDC001663 TaxID=3364597 RepID=UPI0036ABCC4E
MTSLNPRAWLGGCAVAASVLLLTSCTSGSGKDTAGDATHSPAPSNSAATTGPSEKKVIEQAQAALTAVQSGKFFAAGAERVTDGVHTETILSKGKNYKLNLVCFGSGSAQLSFTPASTGSKATVPCDQSLTQQRITGDRSVRIDVDAAKGATGVVAWQIDAI